MHGRSANIKGRVINMQTRESAETPKTETEAESEADESESGPDTETELEIGTDDIQIIVDGLHALQNWSQMIRYLHSHGFKNSSIAHILSQYRGYPMSPQQVNNVLSRPLKTDPTGTRMGRPKAPLDERATLVTSLLKPRKVDEQ